MVAFVSDIDQLSAPAATSAAPAMDAIDLQHLSRMTLGERSLEREVLALFDRQADMLLPRVRCGKPAVVAASFLTELSSTDLERLRTITRRAHAKRTGNILPDEICDEIIVERG